MANIQDQGQDIIEALEKTISRVCLKRKFSQVEKRERKKYGLHTALIAEDKCDDHVIYSPHHGDDPSDLGENMGVIWLDTRQIKTYKNKNLNIVIEKDVNLMTSSSDLDYQAIIYLIPEYSTCMAWSGMRQRIVS